MDTITVSISFLAGYHVYLLFLSSFSFLFAPLLVGCSFPFLFDPLLALPNHFSVFRRCALTLLLAPISFFLQSLFTVAFYSLNWRSKVVFTNGKIFYPAFSPPFSLPHPRAQSASGARAKATCIIIRKLRGVTQKAQKTCKSDRGKDASRNASRVT